MGFSLKLFIKGLEELINDGSLNMEDKLDEIEEAIQCGKEYAEKCGQLN